MSENENKKVEKATADEPKVNKVAKTKKVKADVVTPEVVAEPIEQVVQKESEANEPIKTGDELAPVIEENNLEKVEEINVVSEEVVNSEEKITFDKIEQQEAEQKPTFKVTVHESEKRYYENIIASQKETIASLRTQIFELKKTTSKKLEN